MILRDVRVQVLETGGLAEAENLIMNKSISKRVKLQGFLPAVQGLSVTQ